MREAGQFHRGKESDHVCPDQPSFVSLHSSLSLTPFLLQPLSFSGAGGEGAGRGGAEGGEEGQLPGPSGSEGSVKWR